MLHEITTTVVFSSGENAPFEYFDRSCLIIQVDRKIPEGEGQEDAYVLFYRRSGLSFTVNLPENQETEDVKMENANAFPGDRICENVNENAGDQTSEIEMEGERISHENDQTDPLVTIGD